MAAVAAPDLATQQHTPLQERKGERKGGKRGRGGRRGREGKRGRGGEGGEGRESRIGETIH